MDIASDIHPYSDQQTHQIDASGDTNINPDGQNNHCQRCCHAHVVSITSTTLASTAYIEVGDYQLSTTPDFPNHAQAPPTPPPTA